MREAGKIADQQIRNISERTAPTFSGEHEMICVNTWGQTRVSEALSWQEYDLGKKKVWFKDMWELNAKTELRCITTKCFPVF